jgi:hypothetical protein
VLRHVVRQVLPDVSEDRHAISGSRNPRRVALPGLLRCFESYRNVHPKPQGHITIALNLRPVFSAPSKLYSCAYDCNYSGNGESPFSKQLKKSLYFDVQNILKKIYFLCSWRHSGMCHKAFNVWASYLQEVKRETTTTAWKIVLNIKSKSDCILMQDFLSKRLSSAHYWRQNLISKVNDEVHFIYRSTVAHPKGACRAAAPPNPQNRNLKNTGFLDIMISDVLRDLLFSRNQPLKSADD